MTRSSASQAGVTITSLAPVDEADIDEGARLLYRAVPEQLEPPPLNMKLPLVTPEQAAAWLKRSEADPMFANRATRINDVRRWRLLMETGRFVQWMPDGPILLDGDLHTGVLLNGKHRYTALAGHNAPLGLVVITGVPRWMMRFFDTGRGRTLNDVFATTRRAMGKRQVGWTLKLALRYEEFLHGRRRGIGWRDWRKHKDEHTDLDEFASRREPLIDLFEVAVPCAKATRLDVHALMVFRFYQELAWPDGVEQLQAFWDGLSKGAMLSAGTPALTLREWGKEQYEQEARLEARRETHLLLLTRFFDATARGERINQLRWAFGMPMPAPYHPDGPAAAAAAVREGLARYDAEAHPIG